MGRKTTLIDGLSLTNIRKINLNNLSKNKYSENIVRHLAQDKYKSCHSFWYIISKFQDLSEDFIREFKDQVSWWNISAYQDLSEDFIREFKDKVGWWRISQHQDLSEEFLIEFIKKIKLYLLIYNKKIPEDVKERIINLKKLLEMG